MIRFDPADYPAYTFNPESGTPSRVTAPRRGPFAKSGTRILEPSIRKSDGRECFHLQRADGHYRMVSRNQILDAIDPFRESPALEPPELPPWSFPIPGFDGYALLPELCSVIRYYNPNTGPVNPPAVLKPTTRVVETLTATYRYVTFSLTDEVTGRKKMVPYTKLEELCGITGPDRIAAYQRGLARRAALAAETQPQSPRP